LLGTASVMRVKTARSSVAVVRHGGRVETARELGRDVLGAASIGLSVEAAPSN
jgi:hypothetical protein